MTLPDLAALGSFVSGFAVLISLIFLYFQLRQVNKQVQQAERNQQAAIQQAANHQRINILRDRVTEPSLAEAYTLSNENPNDLTVAQWLQYTNHAAALLSLFEDAFYQYKHGLLSDDVYEARLTSLKANLAAPNFRVTWNRARRFFGREYAELVDRLIAETPVSLINRATLFAEWKAEVTSAIARAAA